MNSLTFANHLNALDPNDDFIAVEIDDLIGQLTDENEQLKSMDAIFLFIEGNPNSDLGSPGPFVHFLERFAPVYFPKLINSIEKSPTPITLDMLNRILNTDLNSESRICYMNLLLSVSKSSNLNQAIINIAKDYYEYQQRKGS